METHFQNVPCPGYSETRPFKVIIWKRCQTLSRTHTSAMCTHTHTHKHIALRLGSLRNTPPPCTYAESPKSKGKCSCNSYTNKANTNTYTHTPHARKHNVLQGNLFGQLQDNPKVLTVVLRAPLLFRAGKREPFPCPALYATDRKLPASPRAQWLGLLELTSAGF